MDIDTYPGKGLSLSQLIFALNEELRRVACSSGCVVEDHSGVEGHYLVKFLCSFTLNEVSQLHREIFTALAAVREWKNSFVPINRIPTEILSLIPTHLSSHEDRFRASFVCRHWRRTFIRHGALWSQLFLGNGEEYVTTLLERAKGSALDIVINDSTPFGTISLLSPRAQQIRSLVFEYNPWIDIIPFSEVNSGPLPLLRTLEINHLHHGPGLRIIPSFYFFGGALNLEQFILRSDMSPIPLPLTHFVFPALTTVELTIWQEGFDVLDLLDFFKTSPLLRAVDVDVFGKISLDRIPRGTVVIPPCAETFSLSLNGDALTHIYDIVLHISFPRAGRVSLAHGLRNFNMTAGLEILPTSASWNTIVYRYTTSPIEEVTLEIIQCGDGAVLRSLIFRSSDTIVITFPKAASTRTKQK